MKIVADDKIPYLHGQAERLGETVYLPGASIRPADVRDADALIVRTRTRCDRALLAGSRVRFIATATIGYDHLDTDYLAEAHIGWANAPGCNAGSVAQYVRNSLLLLHAEGTVRLGKECTVGIIGAGHVGQAVARALRPYGCRLLLCDPPRSEQEGGAEFVPQETIEREADVITFHTPLTHHGPHATFHLADADFFRRLTHRPAVINAARGEVVCTEALRTALRLGQVRTAVIDTWENEPDIDRGLLAAVRLGTPHIAGYSADGKANGTRMALTAVARHFGLSENFGNIRPPALPEGFLYFGNGNPEAANRNYPDSPLRLYDPERDSRALKSSPGDFELLRGNYPLRREHDG